MRRSLLVAFLGSLVGVVACSDDSTPTPNGGNGGGSATGGAGTNGGGGSTGSLSLGGNGGSGGVADLCEGTGCPPDQHCEVVGGAGTCVNNDCATLVCGPTEECEPTPGGGAICVDISCAGDVDCPPEKFCDSNGLCALDVCVPGARSCVGQDLFECSSNGGDLPAKTTCGSTSYFGSACVDAGNGVAGCTCEDDWDCPAFMSCEAGECTGTGKAPTCTLPPIPFDQALPVKEIQWGGTGQGSPANNAVNAPFPTSSQACATPIVANLDDDNGDGLIDERDFPEIVFMTYCGTDISTNGVVRAIHGGGAAKGQDYFATCGDTVWHEGDPLNMACACATAEGNSTAAVAAGDLDGDGVPEIIVPNEADALVILDNHGNVRSRSAATLWAVGYVNAAPTIANLDLTGLSEIVVGNNVFTLELDVNGNPVVLDRFSGGTLPAGQNGQGPVPCLANVTGGPELEIIAGTTVYAMPTPPPGVTKRADCAMGAVDDFCAGKLTVVWDGQTVNGAVAIPNAQRDGFCAVADVLGMDETIAPSPLNPLDGTPEVVVVANGRLYVLNGAVGTLRRSIDLAAGANGGAPNVDDFDGDGFPEIGTAFGSAYLHIDLQDTSAACPAWPTAITDGAANTNPARAPGATCTVDADCAAGAVCNTKAGSCVCLHNGWKRITEDDSSRVTSSSVFDFNGDGAAEVVYNDECFFRVYDGRDGTPLFKNPSPSRTRIENPVIADVDNDGNAEIVFPSNNDSNACSVGNNYPNGIAVWGDAADAWVSARRVWNEHSYHVTNVTEAGSVPQHEPEHWKSYNGRSYNTYRSNPRAYDVAPDLTVSGVQITSPGAACGTLSNQLDITVEIKNAGDLRVGPGVVITFDGQWTSPLLSEPLYADATMTPLTIVLQQSIEPGASLLVTASYDAVNNAPGVVPDDVVVTVDALDTERECLEDNNVVVAPVDPGTQQPDLRLDLGVASAASCPSPTVQTTLFNDGSAPASNILVRYYAGDPSQGGSFIAETTVAGPIAAGASESFIMSLVGFPVGPDVLVYGVADPTNAIAECNDGNNKDFADAKIACTIN